MQVADIFMLGAKITQLGMDQRKVNMLAREVGPMLGYWKPVVVSHHMLMGLSKPARPSLTSGELGWQRTLFRERSKGKCQSRCRTAHFYDRYMIEDIKRKI